MTPTDAILAKMRKAFKLRFVNRDFDKMVADLKEGHLQCFWNDDAIIVTEICVSPRRRFLNIFLAAGNLKGVFALTPQVVQFARENGLAEAQGQMRLGWGPVLRKRGWKKLSEIWTFPTEHWDD